jgi:isoquinoline 1-oxidoreductase subunit alpha
MIKLTINGQAQDVDVAGDTPLLWVLRDTLGLTGTKFGCGKALCGACTVHIDGAPTRSCITPVETVAGKSITTIEGLASNPKPSDADIDSAMSGNICRCGTYPRIRKAIHRAAELTGTSKGSG